jgi:hypothetical protein
MGFLGIATQWQRQRHRAVARDERFLAHILDDSGYGASRNRQKFYRSDTGAADLT